MNMPRGRSTVSAQPTPSALNFERHIRADVHRRRWVRVHIALIGLVTFGVLWGISHALLRSGLGSMALRHGIALLGAYAVYLGLLWAWGRWLVSRDEGSFDIPDPGLDLHAIGSSCRRTSQRILCKVRRRFF